MAYQPKSYRKFVATAATATLVAGAIAPLASAASFTDVGPQYKEAVDFVVSKGAQGLTETKFGVSENIKRVDAAVLLVKVLGLDIEKAPESGFTDVPERAEKYVNALKAAGITSGKSDTKFDSDSLITRGELAVWIQRGFDLKGTSDVTFTDVPEQYEGAVSALIDNKVTNGINDTQFGTNKNAKRGDYAIFLKRAHDAVNPLATVTVEEIKVVDSTTLTLKLKGDVKEVKATDFKFDNELEVKEAKIVEAPKAAEDTFTHVELKTSAQKAGAKYTLTELFGNKVAADKAPSFTTSATPAVESVNALNLKQVEVTFNKDVDVTTAETVTNYSFPTAAGLTVKKAVATGNKVTLTFNEEAKQQQAADLTIENVKDTAGVAIGKTTKSVKFFDVTAPTVKDVTVIGPKTLKVKFSEVLKTAPKFSVNDGTLSVVSTEFTAGSDEAIVTLGAKPTVGTHKLTIEDGVDYAGYKVEKETKEFTFAEDTTVPTAAIKKVTANQVVVEFSEEVMNLKNNSNVQFFHTTKGVAAYEGTVASVDGKEVTLNFANPLPEGAFKLFVAYKDEKGTQISDLWGNKFAAQTLTGTFVADTAAPTVTKIEAKTNQKIEVTFSEKVNNATTLSNYTLKDTNNKVVSLSGVTQVDAAKNVYELTVAAPLNGGSYNLTIKGIEDTSKNKLVEVTNAVTVKDTVAPEVKDLDETTTGIKDAQRLSNTKVKVAFTEAMDKASIENKNNYKFAGANLDSKVTVTAVDNNTAVILDFKEAANFTTFLDAHYIEVGRVLDVAGNPTTALSTSVEIPNTVSAPLFDKAEVTDKNTVKLYFKELITGAKTTDFLVKNAADQEFGKVTNISNDVVEGKSVITLTTEKDLPTTAAGVEVKTATEVSAANQEGAKIVLDVKTVTDKYAPLFSTAVTGDADKDSKLDQMVVTFSENLYAPSVQESDFFVEGYEVTSVSTNGAAATLTLKEKDATDFTATPKVSLVGAVEDAARNSRATLEAITSTVGFPIVTFAGQGASPFVLGAPTSFEVTAKLPKDYTLATDSKLRFKAVVTKDGKPVSGLEVNYNQPNFTDKFTTDAQGVAYFGPETGLNTTAVEALKADAGVLTPFKVTLSTVGNYDVTVSLVDTAKGDAVQSTATFTYSVK